MTDANPRTGQHGGIVITTREVYDQVQELDGKLDRVLITVEQMVELNKRADAHAESISKIQSQIAAQWVVHTLMLGGIGVAISRVFS